MKSSTTGFSDRLPLLMLAFGLVFAGFAYGMVATVKKWFPFYQVLEAGSALTIFAPENKSLLWFFTETTQQNSVERADTAKMEPGLTKLVTVDGDFSMGVRVIDAQGKVFQHWHIEWSDVWPQAPDYLLSREVPKSRPGTHIHGAEILANGDLVFNFEHLGLVRMNPCGEVVWRLPFRTHHSVFVDDNENLWVSAQINHTTPDPALPFYMPSFIEPVILQVSPDGRILQQKSVFDLLKQNDLEGALYAATLDNGEPVIAGSPFLAADSLHLNDVDVFSHDMAPGVFQPGDIMISLRNLNAVMVFDPQWKLKYSTSHGFVRQHDPDFIDGNRISVFDNHNTATREDGAQSRIVIQSAATGEVQIPFTGTRENPFFTNIMGKHQWLPNGNLLLSESRYGRALEISPAGEKVWEYYNLVEPGWLGILEEAERLPEQFDAGFFAHARDTCHKTSHSATALQGESP